MTFFWILFFPWSTSAAATSKSSLFVAADEVHWWMVHNPQTSHSYCLCCSTVERGSLTELFYGRGAHTFCTGTEHYVASGIPVSRKEFMQYVKYCASSMYSMVPYDVQLHSILTNFFVGSIDIRQSTVLIFYGVLELTVKRCRPGTTIPSRTVFECYLLFCWAVRRC